MTEEMEAASQELDSPEPRTKVLANGAVYDLDRKRIIGNPGGGTTAITQANSTALAEKRWRQVHAASRRAICDVSGSKTSIEAFGKYVGAIYQAGMDADSALRDRVIAGKFVAQAADLLPDPRGNGSGPAGLTITMEFGPEIAQELVAILDKRR